MAYSLKSFLPPDALSAASRGSDRSQNTNLSDLAKSVHRGGWWVKVDVIGKLRSGSAATSRALRSIQWIAIGEPLGCRFTSGPVEAAHSVSWAADWLAVLEQPHRLTRSAMDRLSPA